MKKSHVSLLLIAAFALGIFINKTYEIRQAHAASNYRLKVEMRKTRGCIATAATALIGTKIMVASVYYNLGNSPKRSDSQQLAHLIKVRSRTVKLQAMYHKMISVGCLK